MHIAYIDDSGDQRSVVLGALLVPSNRWLEIHDQLVAFRRELSSRHGFRMRHEMKASQIVSHAGPWHKLNISTKSRFGIYRAALREVASMAPAVRAVAVVIPDRRHPKLRDDSKVIVEAWDVLLERIERFCSKSNTHVLLMPDDGNPRTVRSVARRRRRFGYAPSAFGGSGRAVPFRQLVDDPAHRDSSQSYLCQWADLVAYAAFRKIVPRADVPDNLWDDLGDACLHEANSLARRGQGSLEPPGIIVWPDRMRRSGTSTM